MSFTSDALQKVDVTWHYRTFNSNMQITVKRRVNHPTDALALIAGSLPR